MHLSKKLSVAALGTAAVVFNPIAAFAAESVVESANGPLVRIATSDTLNCSVNYKGDMYNEFFNRLSYDETPDCGTFLASGGSLYGPGVLVSAGINRHAPTSWTPVSQTKSGSGTAGDPSVLTTVVRGGAFEVTQVDTYVDGNEFYETTMHVKNLSASRQDYTLYHAGDCYLQDRDEGYGEYDSNTAAVICRAQDPETSAHTSRGRVEQFIPKTAGSNYFYGEYESVWAALDEKKALPDRLERAEENQDNGMALSWTRSLDANQSADFALLTSFSPTGRVALSSTTCAVAQPGADATATRTIGVIIANPNPDAASAQTVTATLSDDATYVAKSVSGASEPTVDGKVLTFKDIRLPAGGAARFSFLITGSAEVTPFVKISGVTTSGGAIVESDTSESTTCDFPELPKPTPEQPEQPEKPQPTPQPEQPEKPQPTPQQTPKAETKGGKTFQSTKALASTGADAYSAVALVGLLGIGGVALVTRRRTR